MSYAGAEYRGMAHRIYELFWLRKFLKCLGFETKEVMKLYYYNSLQGR